MKNQNHHWIDELLNCNASTKCFRTARYVDLVRHLAGLLPVEKFQQFDDILTNEVRIKMLLKSNMFCKFGRDFI